MRSEVSRLKGTGKVCGHKDEPRRGDKWEMAEEVLCGHEQVCDFCQLIAEITVKWLQLRARHWIRSSQCVGG